MAKKKATGNGNVGKKKGKRAKALPSRIFSYGSLVPGNLNEVLGQIFLGHRYRNDLVQLERQRREQCDDAICAIVPSVADRRVVWQTALQRLVTLDNEMRQRNARARRRSTDEERNATLCQARKDMHSAEKAYRTAKRATYKMDAVKAVLEPIEKATGAEQRRLRKASGLWWCSYLAIEETMRKARKGPPPRFRPYTGEGRVAVQLQGGEETQRGLTIPDLLSGQSSFLQLRLDPVRPRRAVVMVRIGSTGKKKDPIWAEVPIVYHRALPAGASIKWFYLARVRVGTHFQWKAQFVVSKRDGFPRENIPEGGRVGIDLGWRLLTNGDLRSAYWVGDDGNKGEVRVPAEQYARWQRCDTLQSQRTQSFNSAMETLLAWLRQDQVIPDWLREAVATLPNWRSPARLRNLVECWRTQRFNGDEAIYPPLAEWRSIEKKLYDSQEFLRRKAQNWRDNEYRNFAAWLRVRYRRVIFEYIDWRTLAKREMPEESGGRRSWSQRSQVAAVGRLRQLVEEVFTEKCLAVPQHTTQRCHRCDHLNNFDAAANLYHTCDNCGEYWDQDDNAGHNLRDATPLTDAEIRALKKQNPPDVDEQET